MDAPLLIFVFRINAGQYASAIVSLHNVRSSAVGVLLLLGAAGLCGCRRPPLADGKATPHYVPAPSEPATAAAAKQQLPEAKIGLAVAVARILTTAHRTGSLVEHGSCGVAGSISEAHPLHSSLELDPMEHAFEGIAHEYPEIKWQETSQELVRVSDSRKIPSLLKVRIKEFLVIEDRLPQAALPALWRTAEVAAYMRHNNIHLAHAAPEAAMIRKTAPSVIQVKNATVAEILDRMLATAHRENGSSAYRLWSYRECRSGAETFVQIRLE